MHTHQLFTGRDKRLVIISPSFKFPLRLAFPLRLVSNEQIKTAHENRGMETHFIKQTYSHFKAGRSFKVETDLQQDLRYKKLEK